MLFQIIDNKQQCRSIYSNKEIISDPDHNKLSKTWSFNSVLKDKDIKYASLYAQGQNLDQCCPDILKEKWDKVKQKHFAYMKSFEEAKVKFNDYCFYDLVPESFVIVSLSAMILHSLSISAMSFSVSSTMASSRIFL